MDKPWLRIEADREGEYLPAVIRAHAIALGDGDITDYLEDRRNYRGGLPNPLLFNLFELVEPGSACQIVEEAREQFDDQQRRQALRDSALAVSSAMLRRFGCWRTP